MTDISELNDQFRINTLRLGCRILGYAFLIGVITRNYFVPANPGLFLLGISTGVIFLSIEFLLYKRPKSFVICSWIFSLVLIINSTVIALSHLGFSAPVLGILAISPVIASLLLGTKGGIGIYFGALGALIFVYFMDSSQWISIIELPREELHKAKIIVFAIILTISLLISIAYEKNRQITELKLQETLKEKEQSELHLYHTNEIANIGGWSLDISTQKLWWSDQTYRIHELPVKSTVNVADAINYYAKEAQPVISSAVNRCIETGEGWDLELPFITAKKKHIWVRAVGLCHFNADGSKILRGTFQDITEKRMNEQSLKLARDKAVKASAAKSQFLANMSHEIRTPMNGVIGNADLLLDEDLNPAQKKIVSTIIKSGESMLYILNDILDFSKINAGQLSLAPHSFNLREQLQSVYHLYHSLAIEKGIELQLEISENIPDQVYADAVRIRQIVSNLISNALKFTNKGFVKIRVQSKEKFGEYCILHLEVEDSGIGIKQEKINKLFQEFTQADLSTTREFGGTGLGLAISQRLATLFNSEIKVESSYGKGSTFYLDLKLKLSNTKQFPSPQVIRSSPQKNFNHLHILLVEDNAINQELAINFLKKFGIECSLASNGQEAVLMVQKFDFDIVFMDCQMPVMDGYDATKKIRNMDLKHQPKIVAMTANAMTGDEEKCLSSGMDDFLTKPISKIKIEAILERWSN